jgi:EAL domain-containing protein (putative c-di-GMP-specific phosphodiesterase class I)
MAQRLGIDVVAEGAETYEQVEFLRKSNCQQVQGYYYSQAMPLQQLPGFIEKQHFSQRRAIIS